MSPPPGSSSVALHCDFRWDLSLIRLHGLARELPGPSFLHHLKVGIADVHPLFPGLYMSAEDLNSDPCVCVV